MFLQKLCFVVVTSTLLLQRCIADATLSTLKTPPSNTSYLNANPQNSNIEILSDSFSKSDSSFSASQSELSQNDWSVVTTDDGFSLQDSSHHSSNSNASSSDSELVASDGLISKTDSSFAASSSSTAESDSSLTVAPNGTIASSTKSSSKSTTSSSSTTSHSINEQFLDVSSDISFPDDFPHIASPHQTKSLDSIPDFPGDSLDSKPFPATNSKYPPSLGFKSFPESQPNSKIPSNVSKFPNFLTNNSFKKSGSKSPYLPAGTFNSKSTPKIGTPVGPAGLSTSFLPKNDALQNYDDFYSQGPQPSNFDTPTVFPDTALHSPTNNPLDDTLSKSPFDNFDGIPSTHDLPKDFPNEAPHSLNNNLILDDISSPDHSLTTINSLPLDASPDIHQSEGFDTTSISPSANIEGNQNPLDDSPSRNPASSYNSLMHSSDENNIPIHSENTNIPKIDDYDTNSPFAQFPSHQPYDLVKDLSTSDDDFSVPKTSYDSNLHLGDLTSDQYSNPTTLESLDTNQDGSISPDEVIESSNPGPKILGSTYPDQNGISPDKILESDNPSPKFSHLDDHTSDHYSNPTILKSKDTNQDGLISPDEILESGNPMSKTLDSIYPDQNDINSPEKLLEPDNPSVEFKHPDNLSSDQYYYPTTLESKDTNQDGFLSPEEILETSNSAPKPLDSTYSDQSGVISPEMLDSNNPSVESMLSALNNEIDQPKILDSAYSLHSGNDDLMNLSDNAEHLNPEVFSPDEQFQHLPQVQPSLHQPNMGDNYSQKSKFPPYNQSPRPHGPFQSKPLPKNQRLKKPIPYPKPKYPLPFPYNNMPFPYGSPMLPSPYGSPMRPPPYDYPGNFMKPSPWSRYPFTPDLYHPSPPFSPGNPFLNKPLYPDQGSPFHSMQRSHYSPKNWSKIPLKYSQIPQLTTSNLPSSPADLDALSYDQPSFDLPQNSLPPPSLYDSPVPDSPLDKSSSLLQSPYDSSVPHSSLDQPSSLLQSPYDLPVSHSSLDQSPSLPYSQYDSPVPDSSLRQPVMSLNSNIDSPFEMSNSSPSSSLNDESPFATSYNSSPTISHLHSSSPLDFDKNLPLTEPACNNIDNEIFNDLKQKYENTISEYQLSQSIYPRDIAPDFDTITDDQLTFNIVILGSSPAALSALKTLSDMGKSILLIERGSLPPHISKSLYYRPKILQSDYIRQIKSSAPHCDAEKILYAPNVLGEESTYDSNIWDYGVRSKYIKWGKLCPKWTWNNVIEYFTDDLNNPNTRAIPVTTEINNTKAIDTVTSIFNDVGLYRTECQLGKRSEGLMVIPYLQENGENVILAENIFRQLTGCTNIQLALGTTPDTIIFDDVGKAIGVVVKTPCGSTKTITILDELIIGSNPVDTVQFLYQSGIGDHEKLQQLNIPTQINLPYVGKELIITPLYFGVIYLFPQGTLLSDQESDFAGMDYLLGKYGLHSALAVDYFKAASNIYESHEANVVFNFRVFSKSMSERLNSYIERLRHIDEKIKDFLTNLCQEYDILLAVPQLTNVLSRGEIRIDNSSGEFEVFVNTGMYKSKRDITIMQKALKVLKSITETEIFKSMNGKVVQIPVEQCGTPDFSTEYNQCSIRYLSLPNLHYCGGTIMGVSPLTSVVNEDLLIHGTTNVRIFSASVVPYGTSTDSSAVGSLVGNLGAHILLQKYSL